MSKKILYSHTNIFVMENGTVGMEKMRLIVVNISVMECLNVNYLQHASTKKNVCDGILDCPLHDVEGHMS